MKACTIPVTPPAYLRGLVSRACIGDSTPEAALPIAERRKLRRYARRHSHARSRLDRYRADIEALAVAGASSYDIALWLRQFKRTKVNPSTVWRALNHWHNPER